MAFRILWRLLGAVPTLFGVLVAVFLLTHLLPGDRAVMLADNPAMDARAVAELRDSLGLDRSLPEQFGLYLKALAQGDLGQSVSTGQPVRAELAKRLPASLELTLTAFALALMVALPLGVLAALRPGTLADHACRIVSALGLALPTFVTGLILIHVFYARLGLAPEPIGRLDPFLALPPRVTGFLLIDAALAGDGAAWRSALGHLILPALTMAVFAFAPIARMTRAAMLAVLQADFIRTARASGLRPRTIVFTYAFRNALLPVITLLGMVFSYMLGANVLVERVFAWPGIGAFAIDALIALDYAPLRGFVLVMAALFVVVNLLTDLLQALIDPRAGEG